MTGKQLKNSILQLAIQGKLVPQDPHDEPASELLKRIRKEKEQLVKEGKLKKKDLVSEPIADEDKPFEIPEGWEWCKVKDILLKITDGTHHSPVNTETGDYKYITAKNIKDNGISLANISYVNKEVHEEIYARCNPSFGDILYIKDGATTGVCCINQLNEDFSMLSSVALLKPSSNLYTPFLLYCLRSPICYDSVRESMKGTGITRITLTKIEQWIIPLPPLPEQRRIVAKIEELMPLVEEYDKAQTQLDALNASLPEALKKSILQQAIQGKLVPQDPNDEPASVLLKRIRKEKEQLVKEGKLKKKDLVSEPIADEDKPFEIPEGWEWCRLGDIITISSGDGLTSSQMISGNIPVYGGNGITGYHNKANVLEPSVVIGRVGFYCGSVHETAEKAWVTDNAFITKYPTKLIDKHYLIYTLRYMDLGKQHNATAQPVVSGKKIYPLLFPLPPLPEQHRIVAKIEELFAALK